LHPADLRARFPALSTLTYLNAGTNGPLPAVALDAARAELGREVLEGRSMTHYERRVALADELRETYAGLLSCTVEDVALTTSTSEGIGTVLAGLDIGRGDEILTTTEEHPGLIGPLLAAREMRGARLRAVPPAELADAVTAETRVVACSHVSWVSGAVAPAALKELDIPVILDGAQGIGAIPIDVKALGCAAYAGSGQKWLCGPEGTGMLYVAPEWRPRIGSPHPAYMNIADPDSGLDAALRPDARRYEAPQVSRTLVSIALASLHTLAEFGWAPLHERAATLAADLAERLRGSGHEVIPRDRTTLVSWRDEHAEQTKQRLAASGIVIRDLPGRGLLRASVGGWSDESDLERLVSALSA
jgi:L-cysteine/cystine lyase